MLESVKKQLTEHEEEKKREKQTTSSTLQQLGDISKQLKDKVIYSYKLINYY